MVSILPPNLWFKGSHKGEVLPRCGRKNAQSDLVTFSLSPSMKLIIDDELQALLLLSSLPDSWETLVVTLSNSSPDGVLQLAMVKDSLFNEETRRKDMCKDNAQTLVIENRGRSKTRNSKGRGKSRSQSESEEKFKCFYCDKECHIKRNCKAWKNK